MTDEVKDGVKAVMTAFEEFKTTNDARLKEIEKKGAADPILETKLAKIEASLVAHEDLNQKLTLAAAQAKKAEDEVTAFKASLAQLEAKVGRPGVTGEDEAKKKITEYKSAFDSYVRKTERGLTDAEHKTLNEYKVLVAGNDTLGGYYLSPAEMANEIIKAVVLQSPFRTLARVTPIGVASLKLPKRTGTFAATRVGETGTRSETTGYTTGMAEIFCPEMYAEVRISEQMIEDSMFNIEAEMQMEFAEQFAVKEGAEFINSVASPNTAQGILDPNAGTRNTVSGAAATISSDSMVKAFYGTSSTTGLKTAYARNATWIFNRATLGTIRQFKDGNGAYIWLPGLAQGVPNTILGAPYVEMPDMPDIAANAYPVAVGDFSRAYRIVDRVLISVLRDPYTQSGSGQILFRARKRVGGAVVLGEAIVTLQAHT